MYKTRVVITTAVSTTECTATSPQRRCLTYSRVVESRHKITLWPPDNRIVLYGCLYEVDRINFAEGFVGITIASQRELSRLLRAARAKGDTWTAGVEDQPDKLRILQPFKQLGQDSPSPQSIFC